MTLGRSASDFSPVSSFCFSSLSSTSSSPVTLNSIRRTRKFRSTKGASKARRDLINAEIRKLRALLPIKAEERERLSYLHAMSVICTFIRKSVLLQCEEVCLGGCLAPAGEDLLNALPGFLVAMTSEGKLLYVSENVSHYLGLSMVEVLQGDTFYSMITNNDSEKVKLYLQDENLNTGYCKQVDLVLRVQDKQLNWVWLYIIATRDTHSHLINCTNYIISEVMAKDLRHKLCPPSISPPISQNALRSTKRPPLSSTESERRKNGGVSTEESFFFPYSPNSSFSFSEQNIDYIDFMFSSAFCPHNFDWPSPDSTIMIPPSFFCHTEVSVPDNHAELPGSLSDIFLYLEDFNSFSATGIGGGGPFNTSENYGWSSQLSPHPSDPCYSEIEQAEISVLAQQISSLANSFNLYCSKHSTYHSDHTPCCDPNAFLLDKEMIDCVNSQSYVVGSHT
ncbi:Neuronal PAS domain-containing protein 4-like [Bagarius yarrelli]|uniref:Neuronal PAS domain-containing protein 4-like n=1 Tax=Bagarius yarrelli TaxID=175774 RepID=A0A556VVA1_BAGYA|nr:Neuronal PAS domain-containing protein 4-like [Bagarius yarrelli]